MLISLRGMLEEYLRKIPFLRIFLPFAAGVVLASVSPGLTAVPFLVAAAILLLLAAWLIAQPGYYRNQVSGLVLTLFWFVAGAGCLLYHNRPQPAVQGDGYVAVLLETPQEKPKSYRAEVLMTHVEQDGLLKTVSEKLLVYFEKNDSAALLAAGDRIVFKRMPQQVQNGGNPGEFDYRKFLFRKGIGRQVYLPEGSWERSGSDHSFRPTVVAEKIRDRLIGIYEENGLSGDELAILSALTLGYKKSLDPEVTQVFVSTGTMHVLAVSGMHVAIIYVALKFLLGFLRRRRSGRLAFLILSVTALWSYALLTGLSPSVQRAALMFSMLSVGENMSRPMNIYNTMAASAFLIVMVNPFLLFDAGFQLSYLAVLGIIYFQPKIASLLEVKAKFGRYFWDLVNVSIAAQLATFPITSFYFRQFPVYFLLSNLILIPASFVFIFSGAALLLISPFRLLAGFWATVTGHLVGWVYKSLQFIGSWPGALLHDMTFTPVHLVVTVLGVLLLVLFVESRKSYYFMSIMGLSVLFFATSAGVKISQNRRNEIIVYNQAEPVIHLIAGRRNYVLASAQTLQEQFPGREVAAVVSRRRLQKPQPVSFEEDFNDGYLLKSGSGVVFRGKRLWLFSAGGREPLGNTDLVVDLTGKFPAEQAPGKSVVLCWKAFRSNPPGSVNIHYIRQQGAFVLLF